MYSWFKYQVLTWWDILMFWGAYSTVRFVVLLTPSQCVLVFWTQLLVVWQEYSALSLYLFIERNKIMKLNFLYNSPIFIFNLYKPFCNIALKFFFTILVIHCCTYFYVSLNCLRINYAIYYMVLSCPVSHFPKQTD